MKNLYVSTLKEKLNEEIEFQGFVDKIRNLQYVMFIILRDKTGKVQVTIEKNDDNKELLASISNLTVESTVKVFGRLLESPNVKLNGMEIIPKRIVITSLSKQELPFDYKSRDNSLRETRLDYRFLDLRRDENRLLFECQTFIEAKMREYWIQNDFMEIHTPKITAKAAESGAETFKLDYFGQEAELAQSPQFYKQMTMASGFDKVFEIGPVYRAENSHTSYHASEILMIDSEISWIDSVDDVMDSEEAWIKYFMRALKEEYGEKIKETFHVEVSDVTNPFPRINFYEAKKIIQEQFHYTGEQKEDFDRHEEELISKYAKDKYKSDFVFITNYPYSAKSFYVMKDENGITQTYDLIFKGVEITSGAQREHRPEILKKQIQEKGINPETLKFYTDFFEYGCPPHGGYGVGLARIMMRIFEIDNIREATLIYRGPTRLNP